MATAPLAEQLPLRALHSVALKLAKDLRRLGLETISDLLWYFPFRYDDLSQITLISELIPDQVNTIKVRVENIKSYRAWRARMSITEIKFSDPGGQCQATWFRQNFVAKILKVGDEVYLSGKPQLKKNIWQFTNPDYEKVKARQIHSARLVPIYHLSGRITQKQIRFLIDLALKKATYDRDPLPVDLLNEEKWPWQHEALQQIHFPSDQIALDKAVSRLKFQELLYLQLKYQLAKKDYLAQSSFAISSPQNALADYLSSLPFTLTKDQEKALTEVFIDLAKSSPMNRLLEGDVGSGKTIVALLAAQMVMASGLQVAMMAPTEILAEQHFHNALKLLPEKWHENIALYTASQQEKGHNHSSRSGIDFALQNGQIKLIFGTHSLIQEKVSFDKLALVVIDEQHRFGVRQRQELKNKNKDNKVPHLLSLTATPIPRSLALTLYGDLDLSLIKEKPAGRQAIKTFLVPESKRDGAYKFIKEKIATGQQAFVICPLIEESDKINIKSVNAEYERLQNDIFPELEIKLIHGKLKSEQKSKIMADFKANRFPILVATSVIEVGVDIPGATLMVIESAERFGLSQLHQFRGRVGRNDLESFCLLFTTEKNQLNTKRLQALVKSNDGFKLAELDLELRGMGEIFGTAQTGLMKLKIAKLSDTPLIAKANQWSKKILASEKYYRQENLEQVLKTLQTEMHLE